MPRTALIGGTSLLESRRFRNAERRAVATPYGEVYLLFQAGLIFLQRHGLDAYTPPHRIDHRANMAALQAAGAEQILAVGSVGSLRRDIPPGAVVFPDDFYAPHLAITFHDDFRGHRTPGFAGPWRERLLALWRQQGLPAPVDGGTYWQTLGPRFETPAEIRAHQSLVHIVGMTLAAECILAGELDIPYAALCMVDNYANGLTDHPLTYADFKAQVQTNEQNLVQGVDGLLSALQQDFAS
ncbi:MAG: MTAP family purine nucleoside phosphorylase [Magnetococcales bacterium]|nr:MTAP family purine nucleoside phosphorylase [Magnetococcales bacterium]